MLFLLLIWTVCIPQASAPETVWEVLADHYDKDKDDLITREEYTHSDEHWARLDKDKDGVLTQTEVNESGDGGFRGRRRGGRRGGSGGGPPFDMSKAAPEVGELAPPLCLPVLVREPKIQWQLDSKTSWISALESAVTEEKNGGWGIAVNFYNSEEFAGFQAKAEGKTIALVREKMTLVEVNWQTKKDGAVLLQPIQSLSKSAVTLLAAQLSGSTLDLSVFQNEKPLALIFGSYT